VDADGINVFAGQPHWFSKAHGPVVLTPHPGELARLFGQDVQDIQADRCGTALAAAKFAEATVVLKGAGTVVAREDPPVHLNLTGNPGMATGGMGDVLGGLLVALLGRGMESFDAARAAVYLHGRAGDRVAGRTSQDGLTPTDLIRELPYAFSEICER
jgi:NAD(P)H-hydrate epimerase